MIQQLKLVNTAKLLSVFLISFFSVEAINIIHNYFFEGDNFWPQKIIKLLALIIVVVLIYCKEKSRLWGLVVITVCFVVGQSFLNSEAFSWFTLVGFSRYFFFLSLILLPLNFKDEDVKTLCKLFEKIVILNSITILIAVIFQLDIFRSYDGERFGYNGLFFASANSTYFYIIAFIYFLTSYGVLSVFKKWFWWLTVTASLFVGTKSIYLALLLLFILGSIFFIKSNRKKLIVIASFLLVGVYGSILFLNSGIFNQVVQEDGWLSAILSYRNKLFLEETLPYIDKNWKFVNYIFGGLGDPFLRPQLEYIDIFLYFGLFGASAYLFYIFKYYLKDFPKDIFIYTCCIVLLAVTSITGNFFYNASVPIYLIVLKYGLNNQNNTIVL